MIPALDQFTLVDIVNDVQASFTVRSSGGSMDITRTDRAEVEAVVFKPFKSTVYPVVITN